VKARITEERTSINRTEEVLTSRLLQEGLYPPQGEGDLLLAEGAKPKHLGRGIRGTFDGERVTVIGISLGFQRGKKDNSRRQGGGRKEQVCRIIGEAREGGERTVF